MAHAELGLRYFSNGESVRVGLSTMRGPAGSRSEREKFFIDFNYDRNVTGNLETAYQILQSCVPDVSAC